MPTTIKVEKLAQYLEGYDVEKKKYLIDGFTNGFKLEFQGERVYQFSPNSKSATDRPDIVREKIQKELKLGRIIGPFDVCPFPNLKISPLALVPKKKPNSWRLIHNLSYPNRLEVSVNAGISDESASVQYASIDVAIHYIKHLGRTVYMGKTDILSAFRIIPVHPDDYELLGFHWEGKFYVDRCLAMGCRTSCKIFETLSTCLEWIALHKLHVAGMVHVLDDFLVLGPSRQHTIAHLSAFIDLCHDIGIPLSADKTVFPVQIIEFLGITLDSILMEARLPLDKILKCCATLDSMLSKATCSVKEMQSLIGLLNFACSIIQPGRAFLRRMICLTCGISKDQKFLNISHEAKLDMKLWLTFLQRYNGKSMFINDVFVSNKTLDLYTDAAQSKGFGAYYGCRWFNGSFPDDWKSLNIMTLEFYPIILALEVWGHLWKNHSILFFTDNEALVSVINRQSSKDNTVMYMVRHLVLRCLELNILFRAKHIAGSKNSLADFLSRLQVSEFLKRFPQAKKSPCLVPEPFQPLNFWKTLKGC